MNHRFDVFIRELSARSDHRLRDFRVNRIRRVVECDENTHCEPVNIREQAAHARAQLLRQHVEHTPRQIHTRAALYRLTVDRAALFDVVRYVGDVDTHHFTATFVRCQRKRVVKVGRVRRIDCQHLGRTQIAPFPIFLRR